MAGHNNTTKHIERIRSELVNAGMTRYGLVKFETKHLPALIHDDEHIGGVVYGRGENGSAMIIATDRRVIYMDHKFLFRKNDELSYDVVSGVSHNVQGAYAGVVLHTRLGDFKIKFVNQKAAHRFVKFIESRQIETVKSNEGQPNPDVPMPGFTIEDGTSPAQLSQRAKIFLSTHELGVLSSIDSAGMPHGSAVYYAADSNSYIYIVTKYKTYKSINIAMNSKVAFTIYDISSMQTLQLSGIAHIEQDPKIKERVFHDILRPRFDGKRAEMPPIMYLPAGDYVVICVMPIVYKFSDYKTQQ